MEDALGALATAEAWGRKGRPRSARAVAACRTNPWKHGGRARVVSLLEALSAKLNRQIRGATAIIEAYLRAPDDPEALEPLHIEAMIQSELLSRKWPANRDHRPERNTRQLPSHAELIP